MLRRLNPESVREVPETFQGIYSHVVEITSANRTLMISGQIGTTPEGTTHPTFAQQCHQAIDNVEAILRSLDMSAKNIVKVVYYVTSPDNLAELTQIRKSRWGGNEAPAVTTLVISALASPDLLVEIDVTASD